MAQKFKKYIMTAHELKNSFLAGTLIDYIDEKTGNLILTDYRLLPQPYKDDYDFEFYQYFPTEAHVNVIDEDTIEMMDNVGGVFMFYRNSRGEFEYAAPVDLSDYELV